MPDPRTDFEAWIAQGREDDRRFDRVQAVFAAVGWVALGAILALVFCLVVIL